MNQRIVQFRTLSLDFAYYRWISQFISNFGRYRPISDISVLNWTLKFPNHSTSFAFGP